MNIFDDMRAKIQEAEDTLRAADSCADSLAIVLIGRLRHVKSYRLQQLKKELKKFNSQTGRWK